MGAPYGNGDTGAAYVFTREGFTWTRQARLIAADGQAWDDFGACVSISGDTLVVGAPKHNDYSGAAYVFERLGGSWSEPIKLDGGGAALDGHFGASVSISEGTLIVGSPSVGNQTGAAFIFRRVGSDWVADAKLVSSDYPERERFGTSVSIDGNYAVVGNVGMWEAMIDGAVYIFMNDGAAWIEQARIGASDVDAGEKFAGSVSINGNVAAVGEPHAWDSGAVYLFTRTGDQWIGQETQVPGEGEGEGEGGELPEDPDPSNAFQKLTPSDGEAGDYFGACVALDGDHVITGARFDDDKGYDSGSAYIYPLLSVDISAASETVYLSGEGSATTTLSWTSRGLDSVTIDPDIGAVESGGSLSIAPQQTTTYTITGTKGVTSVSDSVTVSVIYYYALPTVSLSATPETIVRGESAALSWSSTNVDSVTLDNGIGSAPMTGSLSVFPVETTTYTITARNSAGPTTASVTITVTDPLPTVDLSVLPAEITVGESATLAWTTTNGNTVSIEPGIGAVEPNGTLVVAPMQTTTYTITATGSGGTATDSVTVTVANPITLQITSPLDGAFVTGTAFIVKGTLTHATSRETGLMVNGVLAIVDGNQFTVNHVPLVQGENTITATATDASGITLSDSITVNAYIPEDYIRLIASPVSGTLPFETTLRIDGTLRIVSSQISYLGPDDVIFIDRTLDEYRVEIMTEGVYTFRIDVTDDKGNVYTDELAVETINAVVLDTLLQDKWAGMKAALISGNIEHALRFHHERYHEKYTAIYNAFGDDLPTLSGQMQDISWISYTDGIAKYRIGQNHDINGQIVTITYYVYFRQGENGLWFIERY